MKKTRLAVVEDQQLFRKGLLSLLKEFPEMDVIIEAENGLDFKEKLRLAKTPPHAVLLDLEMPEMNGFEVTSYLRQKFPLIKIIILTQYNSEEIVVNLTKRGAHGFLLKNNDIEIIVDSIHAVIENGYYFNDSISKKMVKGLVYDHTITPSFSTVYLTEKELEVLVLVCKENTNIQIADKLFIDVRTVETHKRNIIQKTNSKNIIGAVMYALKNKLVSEFEKGNRKADESNTKGETK